jgi:hypothetical protein
MRVALSIVAVIAGRTVVAVRWPRRCGGNASKGTRRSADRGT